MQGTSTRPQRGTADKKASGLVHNGTRGGQWRSGCLTCQPVTVRGMQFVKEEFCVLWIIVTQGPRGLLSLRDPAFCGPPSQRDPAFCGPLSQRDPAFCGPLSHRDPAFCGPSSQRDPAFCGSSSHRDPAFCGSSSHRDPACCGPSSHKNPACCELSWFHHHIGPLPSVNHHVSKAALDYHLVTSDSPCKHRGCFLGGELVGTCGQHMHCPGRPITRNHR